MGCKKSLPDHSKKAYEAVNVFTDDEINQLRKEFMFDETFPLHEKLENAIGDYQIYCDSFSNTPGRDTRAKEQKILLGEVSKRAGLLHEALKKIGLQEEADMSKYLTVRGDSQPLLAGEFADQVFNWNRAARKALKDLDERTSKGGRPSSFIVRRLIRDLHEIYRNGTGREDRITTYSDRVENQSGGRFYDFVESCFKSIGLFKSNASLGKDIKKSLKESPKPP